MDKPVDLQKSHKYTLCQFGWLATCSAKFQKDLLRAGEFKTLLPGDALYSEGKVSNYVYALIDGQIDVHLTAPNNETLVYPFSAPGRWYGLADVIAQLPAFGTAVAGTESQTARFSRKQMLTFLTAEPSRYQAIIAHEYMLRRHIQETVTDLVTSDGLELVARRLLRMMAFEGTDPTVPLTISQFDFAIAVGVSVPTVQRAFRELKKYGAIETSYGKVTVRDVERLKDFVLSFAD